jgi:ferredoxin
MIISENKDIKETLEMIGKSEKLILVGCNQCAAACNSGGETEIDDMRKKLSELNKKVLKQLILDPACNLQKTKKDMKALKKDIEEADAVLSLACGDGTQTLAKVIKNKPVYPANNTLFIGEVQRVGKYEEACRACGKCELGWTGGICPMTACAKGLINGACGGSQNSKCEVNENNDCAWVKIYERLESIGQLDNLREVRGPKDFSKKNNKIRLDNRKQRGTAKSV